MYNFKGSCRLLGGSVLCLTLECDRVKRLIHCYFKHTALHGLTSHRRQVPTRGLTLRGTLERILFCNIYYIWAFDLNL